MLFCFPWWANTLKFCILFLLPHSFHRLFLKDLPGARWGKERNHRQLIGFGAEGKVTHEQRWEDLEVKDVWAASGETTGLPSWKCKMWNALQLWRQLDAGAPLALPLGGDKRDGKRIPGSSVKHTSFLSLLGSAFAVSIQVLNPDGWGPDPHLPWLLGCLLGRFQLFAWVGRVLNSQSTAEGAVKLNCS